MSTAVVVIDYGAGNHASVVRRLRDAGVRAVVSGDPAIVVQARLAVLPGVGAFPAAMHALVRTGLADALRTRAADGAPVLGICLGLQLLADASEEQGRTAGLGLLPGVVRPLPGRGWQVGWNSLRCAATDPLFAPHDGACVYFNHGFALEATGSDVVATVDVPGPDGPRPIAAAVRRGGIVGVQFHPEKSQDAGRALLATLVRALVPPLEEVASCSASA